MTEPNWRNRQYARRTPESPGRMLSIEQYFRCITEHAQDFSHERIPFGVEAKCWRCDTSWVIHVKQRIGDE